MNESIENIERPNEVQAWEAARRIESWAGEAGGDGGVGDRAGVLRVVVDRLGKILFDARVADSEERGVHLATGHGRSGADGRAGCAADAAGVHRISGGARSGRKKGVNCG